VRAGKDDLDLGANEIATSLDHASVFAILGPGKASGGPSFRRGDTNGDGQFDLSDAVAILAFLFQGGQTPGCLDAADVNDSGALDLSDGIYSLGFLFLGGSRPPSPFPDCGADPTDDKLDCKEFRPCR
jgi:hypothetical protein